PRPPLRPRRGATLRRDPRAPRGPGRRAGAELCALDPRPPRPDAGSRRPAARDPGPGAPDPRRAPTQRPLRPARCRILEPHWLVVHPMNEINPSPAMLETLDDARGVAAKLRARIRANVMGRDEVIELVLVALFADGHVLLEDYPGSGKTTLAKSLGHSIIDDLPDDEIPDFRRIQFTPDL